MQLTYNSFANNGATLEGDAKERYAAINKRLAELHTKFANNVLADEEGYVQFLDEGQMEGLSDAFKAACAAQAESRGQAGKYAITNTRSSADPYMTFAHDRKMREVVWRTFYSRGDNGDEHDNNALIAEILQLRDERVGLLGFDNYAAWRLQDRMAKTPERAIELMEAVWPAAIARVKEEVADMQAIADAEGAGITIEPWDYRYYAEKVRRKREVRPGLRRGEAVPRSSRGSARRCSSSPASCSASSLHPGPRGLRARLPRGCARCGRSPTERAGDHVGLWYLDRVRPSRQALRSLGHHLPQPRDVRRARSTVLGSNNSNFVKGAPGEPVLISWDDADDPSSTSSGMPSTTSSADVEYPTLNGGVQGLHRVPVAAARALDH